jgi:teichuronic acid biosynthesis glycosyltransferase TuaG
MVMDSSSRKTSLKKRFLCRPKKPLTKAPSRYEKDKLYPTQ